MKLCALVFSAVLVASSASAAGSPLPPHLVKVKNDVIALASANTTRTDSIAEVRAQLEPGIDALSEWFAASRPSDEVTMTQNPWKNLWYDDPDIADATNLDFGFFPIVQDRQRIHQVVQQGYYYNVSESTLTLFGIPFPVQNFLKGAYEITDPAVPGTEGQAPLNVVNLTFVANSIRVGSLPQGFPLDPLVYLVELQWIPTIPISGPIGVTGELWNVYIDDEIRISAGFDDAEPDVLDLYILRRADRVE